MTRRTFRGIIEEPIPLEAEPILIPKKVSKKEKPTMVKVRRIWPVARGGQLLVRGLHDHRYYLVDWTTDPPDRMFEVEEKALTRKL